MDRTFPNCLRVKLGLRPRYAPAGRSACALNGCLSPGPGRLEKGPIANRTIAAGAAHQTAPGAR